MYFVFWVLALAAVQHSQREVVWRWHISGYTFAIPYCVEVPQSVTSLP